MELTGYNALLDMVHVLSLDNKHVLEALHSFKIVCKWFIVLPS